MFNIETVVRLYIRYQDHRYDGAVSIGAWPNPDRRHHVLDVLHYPDAVIIQYTSMLKGPAGAIRWLRWCDLDLVKVRYKEVQPPELRIDVRNVATQVIDVNDEDRPTLLIAQLLKQLRFVRRTEHRCLSITRCAYEDRRDIRRVRTR